MWQVSRFRGGNPRIDGTEEPQGACDPSKGQLPAVLCGPHSERAMSAHMSPETAAQVAGTTRWTIMRAIKAQRLRATRDNRNQWRITREDLETWQGAHRAHGALTEQKDFGAQPAHENAQEDAHPDRALRAEVETLRQEVERLERDLIAEKARTEGLSAEVAAERARAGAEAKRADREGAAADDLRARLTRAEEERRAVVEQITAMVAKITEPEPAPVRRRGFLARLLGT